MQVSEIIADDQGGFRDEILVMIMAAIGTPQLALILLDLLEHQCQAASVSIFTADPRFGATARRVLTLRTADAPCSNIRHRYAYSPAGGRSVRYVGLCETLPTAEPLGMTFGQQRPANGMSILLGEGKSGSPFDPLSPKVGFFLEMLILVAEAQARRVEAVPTSTRLSFPDIEGTLACTHADLTLREREVCARTVMGMTATGISLDLGISVTTVATYRRRAYTRLGICSAYELLGLVISAPRRTAPAASRLTGLQHGPYFSPRSAVQ